ncbi:host cell division inhibitor Icd-like protein [Escherichia coli]|uniref:host cell division inhibitor Icd-like protein n=1 Tax=Escherichia coli TaxID=562 RepID=UPI00224801F7|nr:host cell division inhibitor Icd-like protein [Escherichia coli]MCX0188925.1 host cell division inhibitor Icd-like protein [Escherichia coli]
MIRNIFKLFTNRHQHIDSAIPGRYTVQAPYKAGAGIGVLKLSTAMYDAPASFLSSAFAHIQIMVGWAGAPKGAPVSVDAGYANPVQFTTSEIGVSGGGSFSLSTEAAIMATTLTPSHPEFVFVFAAVRRADRHPRICMLRTVAGDERSARRSLVRDYVLSLAARLPVVEVSRA